MPKSGMAEAQGAWLAMYGHPVDTVERAPALSVSSFLECGDLVVARAQINTRLIVAGVDFRRSASPGDWIPERVRRRLDCGVKHMLALKAVRLSHGDDRRHAVDDIFTQGHASVVLVNYSAHFLLLL